MQVIGFDTETHLIRPGMAVPRMVCLSAWDAKAEETGVGELYDRKDGVDWFWDKIRDPGVILTAHHLFYDLGIMAAEDPRLLPEIFAAIESGRARCTKIRQMMIDNAKGELKFYEDDEGNLKNSSYYLWTLVLRHFKKNIRAKKDDADAWRLRYAALDGVPIRSWPEAASTYAIEDSMWGWRIYNAQDKIVQPEGIPGETGQHEAAWALQLMSIWGVRTELEKVEELEVAFQRDYDAAVEIAMREGLMRIGGTKKAPKSVRTMKVIRERIANWYSAQGRAIPMTPKSKKFPNGQVSTERDVLQETDDEGLLAVSDVVRYNKLLTTYIPVLKSGSEYPINASYNPIIETFRTSCARPNLQNLPRKGGVRDCFIPRPNWVFGFCDYSTLELRTLAQVCLDLFGYSAMADALRADQDLHLAVGADMMGISYEEAEKRMAAGDTEVEDMRQGAKPANFGFPGGMAPPAFVEYAKKGYGIEVSIDMARKLHSTFRRKWHEMEDYFAFCKGLLDPSLGLARAVVFVRSGMVRGMVPYTAVCNGFFQHLAAMGAKAALYAVVKECYLVANSPLFGCRPWLFAHDEIGLEIPYGPGREHVADAAMKRLSEIMRAIMQKWVPDIPIKAEGVMCRRWYKGAKPAFQGDILVPSKPVKDAAKGKTIWVPDMPEAMAA